MKRIIQSPSKYIQGAGILGDLHEVAEKLGEKGVYGIVSPSALKKYEQEIKNSFTQKSKLNLHLEGFAEECCKEEVDRIIENVKKSHCDIILGMGGGKVLDVAKAVAFFAEIPVIIFPTAASSDAPCSALSVLYTKQKEFDRYLILKSNPAVVMVDISVIAKAPVRLLVAGMGDALATFFEARACQRSGALSVSGGTAPLGAMAIATACIETLYKDGLKAKLSVEAEATSQALENIVEANTYLSGIGFESGGLAAAHAVHNGLTVLPETHSFLHGEKVAFGTLVQLVLENAPHEEIEKIISFCKDVGLPKTLKGIGVTAPTHETIFAVAKATCEEGSTVFNMPFAVTPEDVHAAILLADKLGSYA